MNYSNIYIILHPRNSDGKTWTTKASRIIYWKLSNSIEIVVISLRQNKLINKFVFLELT